MYDNMTVDGSGKVLLQEDVGRPGAQRQDLEL